MGMNKPSVYEYEDFRQYLAVLLEHAQVLDPSMSQRKIAREAGISNPGYLNDVIQGRRPLSRPALEKLSGVFGLSAKETDYLRVLVDFGQSKKADEKEAAYKQMLARRARSSFARLNPALVKYYQDPKYPVVRAAIEACDFRGDYERLSAFLDPHIPASLLRKIVEQLLEWGLVYKKEQSYFVADRMLEPAPTMGSQVRQLNKQWMNDSAEALDRFGRDERHISSILMAISPQTRATIEEKVIKLRQEVFELLQSEQNPQELWQLSLALFPRSEVKR